ncbi:LysE/ArgO family amino acid transporter [Cohnella yongneupensis]|uniref:LysE/ArgO family amino acid transporter n=1 Tax=Cohnella yongneupensis TaxID=425006 RepID=A0ABW0R6B6_9BACL
MNFDVIINAFILAIGLILPLGVQNLFVFNQGAAHSRYYKALPVVITASICDTLLILFAVGGVSTVALGHHAVKVSMIGAGILFLLYMGWVTWNSKPKPLQRQEERVPPRKQIAFALSVSLLNPHAILDTVGVIGTSSLKYGGADKVVFALTCIVVSWLWFASLAYAGKAVGSIDRSGNVLGMLNRVSALFMWGTALYLVSSLFD